MGAAHHRRCNTVVKLRRTRTSDAASSSRSAAPWSAQGVCAYSLFAFVPLPLTLRRLESSNCFLGKAVSLEAIAAVFGGRSRSPNKLFASFAPSLAAFLAFLARDRSAYSGPARANAADD